MNREQGLSYNGFFGRLGLFNHDDRRVMQVCFVPLGEVNETYWEWFGVHHALKEILRRYGLDPSRLWRG